MKHITRTKELNRGTNLCLDKQLVAESRSYALGRGMSLSSLVTRLLRSALLRSAAGKAKSVKEEAAQ